MRTTSLLYPMIAAAAALTAGCGGDTEPPPPAPEESGTTVSSTLALTSDDKNLWVVNQDADSVTVIATQTRSIVAEIPLGATPAPDPATKRYEPAQKPRALAIVNSKKVYVAAERGDAVIVIDAASHAITTTIPVHGPTGIAAAKDGSAVYVVSHEAGVVSRIDPAEDTITATAQVTEHPWGVTVSDDGASVFVTHLLLDPGVTVLDGASLAIINKTLLPKEPPGADKRLPNGEARGLYTAAPRPGTGEIWVPHLLLGVDTPQPALDFESTVFPTISTLDPSGAAQTRRLLFQPAGVPGAKGSFIDSVSGPRAVAFTPSGKLALVALSQSEDVMIFDAETGNEKALVRPLPSAFLEGIVVDHAGKFAYVEGRNTHDVTVLALDEDDPITPAAVDGPSIDRLQNDPMPKELRLGQRLFYSANSAAFPITKNFWVACSSCHIEGGSDAVTWIFAQGPRDTPSNAGGPLNAGFLFRQAARNKVEQYDETIRVEQGGNYDINEPSQQADLAALAAFVNLAIPFPQNPYQVTSGPLFDAQERGKVTFENLCASCHSGPYFTDSGVGNPTLDLNQAVVLHDIGTCVTSGPTPDKAAKDVLGNARTACEFDTPSLRGIHASAPYLHDGSARTLRDVVDRLSFSSGLTEGDKDDLVSYLQSL